MSGVFAAGNGAVHAAYYLGRLHVGAPEIIGGLGGAALVAVGEIYHEIREAGEEERAIRWSIVCREVLSIPIVGGIVVLLDAGVKNLLSKWIASIGVASVPVAQALFGIAGGAAIGFAVFKSLGKLWRYVSGTDAMLDTSYLVPLHEQLLLWTTLYPLSRSSRECKIFCSKIQ